MKKRIFLSVLCLSLFFLGCKASVDSSIRVTGVSLSNTGVQLIEGATFQLSATITPQDATNPEVTYSSDNEPAATVDGTGLITAGTPGTAVITVTTEDGGLTAACTVTVTAAPVYPTNVSLDRNAVTLAVNGTDSLTATVSPANATSTAVTWSSSDTNIVSVSDSGVLTGIAPGTAKITVTTVSQKKTATCDVTVLHAFTVSFDTGNGSDVLNQVIVDGSTAEQPADPSQNGYTFGGWYSDQAFTTAFDFATGISADTTVYAKWEIITYTISYTVFSSTYSGGNSVSGSYRKSYTVESSEIIFGAPSSSGLIFLGWFTDETYATEMPGIPAGSYGDVHVYAKWVKEISVSFDANGGSGTMNDLTGASGSSIAAPGSGFTSPSADVGFAGWATTDTATTPDYSAGDSIPLASDDIQLYAVWKSMYTYEAYANGTGIILTGFSDYFDGSTTITLPSTIDGETVTAVSFYNAGSVKNTIISLTLPDSVTTLEYRAFYGCNNLETLDLGGGLTTVKYYAAYYCRSLSSVTIPETLKEIPYHMFAGCNNLASVNLPSTLETIGYRAFYSSGLESISIPASVTSIAGGALEYCTSLASISVDTANADYKAIDNILFSKDGTVLYQFAQAKADTSYTVPEGVTTLKQGAFQGSSLSSITLPSTLTTMSETGIFAGLENMTSITIPEGVTELGGWSFSNCSSLESITLPSTLEKFGQSCFTYCNSLESITLPASVNYITNYAFYNCDSMTSITLEAATPPTISSFTDVFPDHVAGFKLYVPAASVETYKHTSIWSDGASFIEAIPSP